MVTRRVRECQRAVGGRRRWGFLPAFRTLLGPRVLGSIGCIRVAGQVVAILRVNDHPVAKLIRSRNESRDADFSGRAEGAALIVVSRVRWTVTARSLQNQTWDPSSRTTQNRGSATGCNIAPLIAATL